MSREPAGSKGTRPKIPGLRPSLARTAVSVKSFLVLQVVGSQLGQPGVNGRGSVGYEVQASEPPTSWTLKVTLGTSALILAVLIPSTRVA